MAADDLAQIVDYIRMDNPAAAQRVAQTIYKSVARLGRSPGIGRPGLAVGTRELVFSPWPYIAVYEVVDDHIVVLRVRHGARDWP